MTARPAGRSTLLWRSYVLAAAVLVVLVFAVPSAHLVLWGLLGLSSAAAVAAGPFVHQAPRKWPWLLVALALATFASGDIVYDFLTSHLHLDNPFPSAADGFYLATYPLVMAGLLCMIRARSRGRDASALLDALIVTTACGLLSWLYLIQPYVQAGDMSVFAKLTSVAYPLGDIGILCVLARLLSGGGRRNGSLSLLALGAAGLLAADVAYGTIQLHGDWKVGGPTDLGWVLFYVCWGAAALHPSMRQLTERQPQRDQQLSRTTLAVLSATTLVAPALLVWRGATGQGDPDTGVIGLTAAALFILVMARMTRLARAQAAQARRERALRASGERLVAASELDAVEAVAFEAVPAIAGPGVAVCVVTEPAAGGPWQRVVAGVPESLVGELLAVRASGTEDGATLVWTAPGGAPGLADRADLHWRSLPLGGPGPTGRRLLVAREERFPLGSTNVLEALASQLTLAAERVALSKDLHRRQLEARFRSLVQNASDVILVAQSAGGLRAETPSVAAVLGYAPEDLAGTTLEALLHPEDGPPAMALVDAMFAGTRSGPMKAEWRVLHQDGRWLDMEVIVSDLSGDAYVKGVVLTLRDVSRRKLLEEELRHQAFHDSLTGLANRLLFKDRVDQALKRQHRAPGEVSVLLADVDDFKYVNDTMGHAAGDELLVQVAGRILSCLREGDTAARLGGDEFAICVESDGRPTDLAGLGSRILEAMKAPFLMAGNEVTIRLSIGITSAGPQTTGAADLLREADLALYAAKNQGKAAFHFFEPELHRAAVTRLERRAALEQAIDDGSLRLHYQPVVRLADREVIGVEALVRWQTPALGLVPPGDFIPLAEESGLIVPMGRWVLDRACADLARWQSDPVPGRLRPRRVSVNVSARQLQSPEFLDVVDSALARYGLEPSALCLEITESLLLQDSFEVAGRLSSLRQRGITLALDDFGTGYSSLSYLHRMPIQVIKIDRSFVSGMGDDPERRSILRAIAALASSLGLDVVAEGIEDETQAYELQLLGCQYGQGYLFGRPVPAEVLDEISVPAAERSLPAPLP